MPFVEVVGSVGAVDPLQIGDTALKVGVIEFDTVKFNVAIESQPTLFVSVTV